MKMSWNNKTFQNSNIIIPFTSINNIQITSVDIWRQHNILTQVLTNWGMIIKNHAQGK